MLTFGYLILIFGYLMLPGNVYVTYLTHKKGNLRRETNA